MRPKIIRLKGIIINIVISVLRGKRTIPETLICFSELKEFVYRLCIKYQVVKTWSSNLFPDSSQISKEIINM